MPKLMGMLIGLGACLLVAYIGGMVVGTLSITFMWAFIIICFISLIIALRKYFREGD